MTRLNVFTALDIGHEIKVNGSIKSLYFFYKQWLPFHFDKITVSERYTSWTRILLQNNFDSIFICESDRFSLMMAK